MFIFLEVLLLVVITLVSLEFFSLIFLGRAPFLSTDRHALTAIIGQLSRPAGTVYELGCGRAGFLRAVEKKWPESKSIGLEDQFFPYFLAKLSAWFWSSRATILKNDFFKVDLREAGLIYCYLNPGAMKKLSGKLALECAPGTVIVSRRFSLPGFRPFKTISDGQGEVFFYRF